MAESRIERTRKETFIDNYNETSYNQTDANEQKQDDDTYKTPLKCYSDIGDGFSGWYAVSNSRRCNDFCYWRLDIGDEYDSTNTADPHQTTITPFSRWVCLLNVGQSKDITWENMTDFNVKEFTSSQQFNYLRCNRDAGERLNTFADSMAKSPIFWCFGLVVSLNLLRLQMFSIRNRFRVHYKPLLQDPGPIDFSITSDFDEDATASDETGSLIQTSISNEDQVTVADHFSEQIEAPHTIDLRICVYCPIFFPEKIKQWKYWRSCGVVTGLLVGNAFLFCLLLVSSLSLAEIWGQQFYMGSLKYYTPACSNPDNVCQALANQDISKPSNTYSPNESFQPFSYLIASDIQLDWFDGESAYLGQRNVPPPCKETDSCGLCTRKFGQYTNSQFLKAFDRLMSNFTWDTSPSIRPNTLVMNGDLTAYFHPSQVQDYKTSYHSDIHGLEFYFPSLGNHDYDHLGGGRYNMDQWWGPPSCNSAHAIAYIKSGLCGNIPKFQPQRIVRYHAGSLAYSWEEQNFHFVHLHYYSTYENAKIGLSSSLQWLEQDLRLANEANLTSIIFVHAAEGMNPTMEKVLANKNVAAIFAGHTHRCFHNKCVGLVALHEKEVSDKHSTSLPIAQKCVPGSMGICGGNVIAKSMSLYYLKDKDDELVLPNTTLYYDSGKSRDPDCPGSAPTFINKTDNTLLCRPSIFYPSSLEIHENNTNKSIPIFWSGSASFETFLKADFFQDRIVINAMTSMLGVEGERYVDVNSLPNTVYPYHNATDLEEFTVMLHNH